MKIVIMMKNWLGDILFQLPAVETIKRDFPQAELICVAPRRCQEILLAQPYINRVLVFDEKKEHRSLIERFRFIPQLKREKADRIYLFHRSKTRAALAWAAGIPERIGYDRGRKFWLTKPISEPKKPVHHLDYFLRLVEAAGHSVSHDAVYRLHISDESRRRVQNKIEPLGSLYCAFHLGANWEPKRWPISHFATLSDLIHERWGIPIVVTGSAHDQPLTDAFLKQVQKAKVLALTGRTTLEELAALYQTAQFVISGDSGPMHIASAVGTPVVALFGPTDPALTGPRGPGKKIILSYIPPGYSAPWYGAPLAAKEWLGKILPSQLMETIEKAEWVPTAHHFQS